MAEVSVHPITVWLVGAHGGETSGAYVWATSGQSPGNARMCACVCPPPPHTAHGHTLAHTDTHWHTQTHTHTRTFASTHTSGSHANRTHSQTQDRDTWHNTHTHITSHTLSPSITHQENVSNTRYQYVVTGGRGICLMGFAMTSGIFFS